MNVTPLPLSVVEISAVVDAYGTSLPRQELDDAVLAIDDWYLDSSQKPGKQSTTEVSAAWAGVVAQVNGGG